MRWSVRAAGALAAAALSGGAVLAGCGVLPTGVPPVPVVAPVAAADGVLHVRLDHRANHPAGPAPLVVVPRGSTVELVVGSDVAVRVSLSGYDRTRFVTAGGTVTMRFVCDRPVEVTTGSGATTTPLGRLDVR